MFTAPSTIKELIFKAERYEKFVASDKEYFYPFYNNKLVETKAFIEYTSKDTYFYNIFIFTKRVKDIGRFNSKVKENL